MKSNSVIEFPLALGIDDFKSKWDLHSHTNFGDGKHSIKQMIDTAEKIGFEIFAITEHVRSSASNWWQDYVKEIKLQRQDRKIKVLIGLEANAIGPDGNVDVLPQMWQDAELILGSVHGYYQDNSWKKIPDNSVTQKFALEYEIKKEIGLCKNAKIHVLAHPGWLFEKTFGEMPEPALRVIFQTAKTSGTAIEINSLYLKNPKKFFTILLEENPTVSFGSNAHNQNQVRNVIKAAKGFL